MRKMLYFILVLGFLITAGNCSGKKESATPTAAPAESQTEQVSELDALKKSPQREKLAQRLGSLTLRLSAYEPFKIKYEDFELKDLKGKSVKLSHFEGQVIFLNFWATWCGPCRVEMPDIEQLYQTLKDKGLAIVTVNEAEETKIVSDFMVKNKWNFPVLLDSDSKVGGRYGASGIPVTYIFDRKGYVVAAAVGAREWAKPEFMEIIEILLQENG